VEDGGGGSQSQNDIDGVSLSNWFCSCIAQIMIHDCRGTFKIFGTLLLVRGTKRAVIYTGD
jgi:hypothetical protein